MLKLRATGRGRHYTRLRGVVESVQALAYCFSWPARLWDRMPGVRTFKVLRHRLELLPSRRESALPRRPLRIAFASDLHLGPMTPPSLLEAAFAELAAAEPDVLALGGDYVSLEVTAATAAQIESLVARVPAPVKLAVLGNHDLWTRHELIEQALERGGARVMLNECVRLPPPHDDVDIVGLDDPWTGHVEPDRAFAEATAPLKLVLAHAPESVPLVEGRGARLLMCGHTHGGQVASPWGPLVMAGRLSKRWPHGLYDIDGMHMFVSRGLGFSDLPLRAFAPPDVAIIDLV